MGQKKVRKKHKKKDGETWEKAGGINTDSFVTPSDHILRGGMEVENLTRGIARGNRYYSQILKRSLKKHVPEGKTGNM